MPAGRFGLRGELPTASGNLRAFLLKCIDSAWICPFRPSVSVLEQHFKMLI